MDESPGGDVEGEYRVYPESECQNWLARLRPFIWRPNLGLPRPVLEGQPVDEQSSYRRVLPVKMRC